LSYNIHNVFCALSQTSYIVVEELELSWYCFQLSCGSSRGPCPCRSSHC